MPVSEKIDHKVRWEEMFPDEIRDAIERCPVCLTVYGLAEPHGPYNALGLDWLKGQALAEMSARTHGGVVAPPCAWHVQERPEFDWVRRNGTEQGYCSSIPADLFLRMVLYQIRTIDDRGFRAAFIISGHGGGLEHDMRLLCEYYARKTGTPLQMRAFCDGEVIQYKDFKQGHAGVVETSQLMYLRPGLVDLERSVENSEFGRFCGHSFPSKKGHMPSEELGKSLVASQIENMGKLQREMLEAWEPKEGYKAPNLNDAEEIWVRFERLTRKYWWLSKTYEEYMEKKEVPFPGWEQLGE